MGRNLRHRTYLRRCAVAGVVATAGCQFSYDSDTDNAGGTTTTTGEPTFSASLDGKPVYRYDAANTGYATGETGPKSDVTVQWSTKSDAFATSPLAVDGSLFITAEEKLVALDRTATRRWGVDEPDLEPLRAPAVDSNHVYATYSGPAGNSYTGDIIAVDRETGERQWTASTGNQIWAQPTVVDGTVYIGGVDTMMYALDAESGEQRWSVRAGRSIEAAVCVGNDTVYVPTPAQYTTETDPGYLLAVDAESGSEQWSTEFDQGLASAPAFADGTVYVGGGGDSLHAINAADGSKRWSRVAGDTVASAPAVVDGVVYIGSQGGEIYALDAEDGLVRWSYDTGDSIKSDPVVADGVVYIGTSSGTVYALDTEEGTELWSATVDGEIEREPAVMGGSIIVPSRPGTDAVYTALRAS